MPSHDCHLTTSFHNTQLNGSNRREYSEFTPTRSFYWLPFFAIPSFLSLAGCELQETFLIPLLVSVIHSPTLYRLPGPARSPLLARAAVPFGSHYGNRPDITMLSISTLWLPSLPGSQELLLDQSRPNVRTQSLISILLLPFFNSLYATPSLVVYIYAACTSVMARAATAH
jgi:hypothetical protein